MATLQNIPTKISSTDIQNSSQTDECCPPEYTTIKNIVLSLQSEGFGLILKYQDKNKAENGNARHIGPDSTTTLKIDLKTNVMQIKSEKSEFARLLTDEAVFDEVFSMKASEVATARLNSNSDSSFKRNHVAQIQGLLNSKNLAQIIINHNYSMLLINSEYEQLGQIKFEKLKITMKPHTFLIKIDGFEEKCLKLDVGIKTPPTTPEHENGEEDDDDVMITGFSGPGTFGPGSFGTHGSEKGSFGQRSFGKSELGRSELGQGDFGGQSVKSDPSGIDLEETTILIEAHMSEYETGSFRFIPNDENPNQLHLLEEGEVVNIYEINQKIEKSRSSSKKITGFIESPSRKRSKTTEKMAGINLEDSIGSSGSPSYKLQKTDITEEIDSEPIESWPVFKNKITDFSLKYQNTSFAYTSTDTAGFSNEIIKNLKKLALCPGSLKFKEFLEKCRDNNFNENKINDLMPELLAEEEQFEELSTCGICMADDVTCYAPAGCSHQRFDISTEDSYVICEDCLSRTVGTDEESPLIKCIYTKSVTSSGGAIKTLRCENIYSTFQVLKCIKNNPENSEKYKSSLVKYFTLPDPKTARFNCIFRCKGKDCDKLFKLDDGKVGGATLLSQGYYCDDCGLEFCMEKECEEEYHAPSFCSRLTKWNEEKAKFGKTSKEELETMEYFLKNTKPCPKCKVKIEKIDGCNKMKCKECKHSFCWICLKPCVNYKHDPSGCLVDLSNRKGDWYWVGTKHDREKTDTTKFLSDSKKDELKKLKEDQKKQAKFETFWARYDLYSRSLISEIKHIKDLDNTIANVKKFQEFGTTTSELKHFRIGGRVLCQARRVLKNMLVEFYFMDDATGMKLLTDFNEKLMETTENLSFSLQLLKDAKKQGGRMMATVVNQQKGDVIDFTKNLVDLCNKVVMTNLETM